MKCLMCQKEFSAKRSDAKTCSPRCRTRLSRALAGADRYAKATKAEDGTITVTFLQSPRMVADRRLPNEFRRLQGALGTIRHAVRRMETDCPIASPSVCGEVSGQVGMVARQLRDAADRLERLGFGQFMPDAAECPKRDGFQQPTAMLY